MTTGRKKRALVLTGAGASIDFGAPSTAKLTKIIKKNVCADKYMQHCGGNHAYLEINKTLTDYLQDGADTVKFEHIYHCAQELLFTFEPTLGAVNEYRPILQPFIERRCAIDENALRTLVRRMAEFIFAELSAVCEKPTQNLDPLANFIEKLRADQIARIYTTNYDDFLLQAAPDLYTGFHPAPMPSPKSFDGQAFWQATDKDSVFHLHGSVHLGFGPPQAQDVNLGALHWFDDRSTALKNSSYSGSDELKMDGNQLIPTAVITGLDKLSHLQRCPFSHYYTSMARDAMLADIIYVIGCGLSDLHLNTWLGEARRKNPIPPLIFVDWWPNGFLFDTAFELERKTTEMFHKLRMHVSEDIGGDKYGHGWTLAKDRTCAIWDKGFLALLRAPDELENALAMLGVNTNPAAT